MTATRAWCDGVSAPPAPDLLIVGQVTIDDVVPATPGLWQRQIGGSSLYAVAGARLGSTLSASGSSPVWGGITRSTSKRCCGGIGVRCVPHAI